MNHSYPHELLEITYYCPKETEQAIVLAGLDMNIFCCPARLMSVQTIMIYRE